MRREQVAAALRYLQDKADLRRRFESATSLDQPTDQDAADVAVDIAAGFVPGVGQAQAARDFERSRRQGDRLGQILAGVGMIPVVGGVGKVVAKGKKAIDKALEARFMRRVDEEFDTLIDEYSALDDAKGGRILNTDTARELEPAYIKDRTKSADVHEPASSFVKKLYAKRLAEPTPKGKMPVVVFTAGGTGAGKSSGLTKLETRSPTIAKAELVYDTNMNKFSSADDKIKQALDSGREVKILFTYRDPAESLRRGALTRASSQEAKFGSGRTVPLAEHGNTHVGSRQVIDQLRKAYRGDDRVEFVAIDNSRGKGNTQVVEFEDLPQLSDNAQLRKRLEDELEEAYRAGEISESTYLGFKDY